MSHFEGTRVLMFLTQFAANLSLDVGSGLVILEQSVGDILERSREFR